MKQLKYLVFAAIIMSIHGCSKLNLFSIQDDINLGKQTVQQIASEPSVYPILDPNTNQAAYAYLNSMRDAILTSGDFQHKDDFEWKLFIIKDDNVQNAFCTPGGYIYVYTGLMLFLDDASSLAGVIGHEMAHADRRHSTRQLTEQYGIETLLSFVGGNAQQIASISAQLVSLQFSRNHETESDTYSVKYLCQTKYRADGAADFFEKIGTQSQPVFLSTHPNPDDRVINIKKQKTELGCGDADNFTNTEEVNSYNQFKTTLN